MDNRRIDNSYEILQEIGKGGTGTVYLAYHKRLEKYVVLKRLNSSVQELIRRREVDILKNLHHPNLPQVYDFLQEADGVYTVMDYIEGCTLADYIENRIRPSQQEISFWLGQIADALKYLHRQTVPIIHCDIKPENIIITPRGDAVLIDFGVSLAGENDRLKGISPIYASPEQLQLARQISYGEETALTLDGRTDIYSLAASFYHLMSGIEPSPVTKAVPLSGMDLGYSEGLLDIIDSAMAYDRQDRMRNAEKLGRSIEQLGLRDNGYRAILILQALSILLSGILLSLGVYFLIAGGVKQRAEEYAASYQAVLAAVEENDPERSRALAEELLANAAYQDALEQRPEERARMLSLLGDFSYGEERYAAAASYYRQAGNLPSEEKSLYFRNELIALAQAGNLAAAQSRMASADSVCLSEEDYLLASAVLAARLGDAASCERDVRYLLEISDDGAIRAQAALAAASAAQSEADAVIWLELAAESGGGRTVTRSLAAAYARLGMESQGAEAERALQSAITFYEILCSDAYPGKTDLLNYAIVLRAAGQTQLALRQLKAVDSDYPEDYRVLMYLAFVSYELGDSAGAAVYCRRALGAWEQDLSENRLSSDSDEIRQLRSLAERFGM